MQEPGAEQRDRNQPARLRPGPVQAGQAERPQAKRERGAGQPPAPLAKQQRERHRQQQQDQPGQRVRVKHVPVKPRAVHALDQLDRKLTHFGRRSGRQGGDLFFDFRRDGFPRVPRLGRQRCRIQFAGLDLCDDAFTCLLESAGFFNAGVREIQHQAECRPPKRQLGQAHPAQHEQPQVKRREARGKMDHRCQRHRPVFRLQKRQQLPPQPGGGQPGEPLGHSRRQLQFWLGQARKTEHARQPQNGEDAQVLSDAWRAFAAQNHALGRVQIIEDDRVAEQEQRGEKPNTGEDQKDAVLLF